MFVWTMVCLFNAAEKAVTARDLTGCYGFLSTWKVGNFLLILG